MCGIAVVGTSGVGKSTLAVAVSNVTGIPYISSQVRPVYEMFGLDPAKQLEFDQKMQVQLKIVELAEMQYKAANSLFITDRSPVDFMAHVLADIHVEGLDEFRTKVVMDYIERCYQVTNLYFQSLILVQPGIKFEERKARPSNPAHLEHLNLLMIGIISDPDGKLHPAKHFLKKSMLDLNRRVETVIKIGCLIESGNMKQRLASKVH